MEMNWIKFSEQSPTEEDFYIIYADYPHNDFNVVWFAIWDKDIKRFINAESEGVIPRVTHWMPLPPPPKKQLTSPSFDI